MISRSCVTSGSLTSRKRHACRTIADSNVVRTKRPLQYEEITATPVGTFYGDSTITPVCDEAGSCILVLYASTDITARKRAEFALKESEEKFSKAFRASPGAMAISEPGGRGFIEVNDGYGNGILSGIPLCTAPWVGIIAADGQVDAEDVVRLFEAVTATNGSVPIWTER